MTKVPEICDSVLVTSNRLRDYVAYVTIALAVGAVCILFVDRDIDKKWLAFALETLLVFGYAIGSLKRLWRQPIFWLVLTSFFVIHIVVFGLALQQVRQWRAPVVGLIGALETGFVAVACSAAVARLRLATAAT
jgi:hypothetical protein